MKRVPLDWASMLTLCLFAQAASYSRKDTLVLGRYFFHSCRCGKGVSHADEVLLDGVCSWGVQLYQSRVVSHIPRDCGRLHIPCCSLQQTQPSAAGALLPCSIQGRFTTLHSRQCSC